MAYTRPIVVPLTLTTSALSNPSPTSRSLSNLSSCLAVSLNPAIVCPDLGLGRSHIGGGNHVSVPQSLARSHRSTCFTQKVGFTASMRLVTGCSPRAGHTTAASVLGISCPPDPRRNTPDLVLHADLVWLLFWAGRGSNGDGFEAGRGATNTPPTLLLAATHRGRRSGDARRTQAHLDRCTVLCLNCQCSSRHPRRYFEKRRLSAIYGTVIQRYLFARRQPAHERSTVCGQIDTFATSTSLPRATSLHPRIILLCVSDRCQYRDGLLSLVCLVE